MAIYKYPQEVHDFVRMWCCKLRDRDLAEACNNALGTSFTESSIKAFRGNHGYRNGKKQWTKDEYWKYQTRYPQGMYEFVRDNSWGVSSMEMAQMVNAKFGMAFSQSAMKQFRQRHGIKSGVTGWFQKGHPPGTKGKKQEEYMSPEAIERSKATRFKPGQRPQNELPVGAIVVSAHGYKLRKRKMTGSQWERWEFLHRAVWAEHNGPVPEGMYVTFLDGDRLNCDADNLILVNPGENAALTHLGYRFENPNLTQSALYTVRLKHKVERIQTHHPKNGVKKHDEN